MVDVAKCLRTDCPKKMSCFRYIADSDEFYQTYLINDDKELTENGCEMYWRCRNGKELAYMNKANK